MFHRRLGQGRSVGCNHVGGPRNLVAVELMSVRDWCTTEGVVVSYEKLIGRMATKRAGSKREIRSVPMKWDDPEKARSEGSGSRCSSLIGAHLILTRVELSSSE